ncbi:uncharacterized protein LOC143846450 [Tasmannia lanceolata]|uniref:uncharacterized protein LOC143846450 n=1 Tax=Tasmannia lanceolata TaxID=3420 RepID=UPI0040643EA9
MADGYGVFNMGSDFRSVRDEEFDEEDVWTLINESTDSSPKVRKPKDSSVSALRRVPTSFRMIPKANPTPEGRTIQQSAPMNIPDWSKIYRKKGSENPCFGGGSWADDGHGHGHDDVVDDDEGVDDDDDWIPPHELVAKKLASAQISSFSVCEGVGRTLKGRDLSKVRNAILTRTGFLE